jgi:hypothetical protein
MEVDEMFKQKMGTRSGLIDVEKTGRLGSLKRMLAGISGYTVEARSCLSENEKVSQARMVEMDRYNAMVTDSVRFNTIR